MAAFALPTCRIAARCCACRTRSGPGRSRDPRTSIKHSLARVFAAADSIDTLDRRHRHRRLAAAADLREALARGQRRARRHADRAGDPHLQHHDRRAAARRRGADRGAMSSAEADSQACRGILRRPGAQPRFRPLRLDAVRAGPSSVARCWRSMPSMSRFRRVREQVSQPLPGEIRLQWWTDMLAGTGHGGVEGNPVAAELLLAIRQLWSAGRAAVAADRGASVRSLQRSDADHGGARRLHQRHRRRTLFSLAARDRRVANPTRSSISRDTPVWPRAWLGRDRVAAGRFAASVVRAAAIAGEARQRHGGSIFAAKKTPTAARGTG